MNIFNELKESLEEAVEIEQGTATASRVTKYDVADVKAIRSSLNVSQAQFASVLGTSVDTIKSWESKRRNPTGLAAKVLTLMSEGNENIFHELAAHTEELHTY